MEHLALHIEYLLLRHDCVILPGFGAFINVRIPARFDAASGKWYPMAREVRFNSVIIQDDGLLTNSYARKYSLPFNEARILLDSDLKEFAGMLDEDGEVTIGKLGTIAKGDDNTIRFTPFASVSRIASDMGYIPVSANKDNEENNSSVKNISDLRDSNGRFNTRKNYYIPINKTATKIAASFMVILLMALSVVIPASDRNVEDKASVLPVRDFQPILTLPTLPTGDSDTIENEKNPVAAEKKFSLIVGTFKSEAEALKFISSFENNDSYELICIPSKTLFRVAAMTSDDKSELITELNSGSFKSAYKEGWIWENKR